MKCRGFSESSVTIYIDGPKSEEDRKKVNEVRDYAQSLKLPNVTVIMKEQNAGLKDNIFTGVTEMCKKHERVIVLEDDLLLSPVVLDYFNEALEKYAEDTRIWSIAGYQYDVPSLRSFPRALVLPFPNTWGWATWSRAWLQYNMADPVDPVDLGSKSFTHAFDVFGIRDFRDMLISALAGKVSCWFTPWYYKIFINRGVSLFPPRTYVAHGGYRGGTHASALNPYSLLVSPAPVSDELCKMPDHIKIDYWAIDLIRASWDARVQNMIGNLGEIKRHLQFWRK